MAEKFAEKIYELLILIHEDVKKMTEKEDYRNEVDIILAEIESVKYICKIISKIK